MQKCGECSREAKLTPKNGYEQRCIFNFPGIVDAFYFVLAVKCEAHTHSPFWKSVILL